MSRKKLLIAHFGAVWVGVTLLLPGAQSQGLGEPPTLAPVYPPVVTQQAQAQERAQKLTEAGIRFEHAEGVIRDLSRAQSFYCAAAKLEYADAFIRLGWMYANGRGVARNDNIAHTMFTRAAKLGSDMGERLTELVRGDGQELVPECLRPGAVVALSAPSAAPTQPLRPLEPTPDLGAAAQFRAMPASIERKKLLELVLQIAKANKLDPRLAFAVIATESAFDPLARSPKGALGLMQLIPDTADRFGVSNVFDPKQNLRGGMAYLRWLLAYFKGDVVLTLAAYNAGEGAVDKHKGVPPFAETVAYVQRIRALYPFDRHPFDANALNTRNSVSNGAPRAQASSDTTLIRR